MQRAFEILFHVLSRFRWVAGILLVLLFTLAAFQVPNLSFTLSIKQFLLPENEAALEEPEAVEKKISAAPSLKAALIWPHPVTGRDLLTLHEIQADLESMPEVDDVQSLGSLKLTGDVPASLLLADLLPDTTLLDIFAEQKAVKDLLIGGDGTALALRINPRSDDTSPIGTRLHELAAAQGIEARITSSGHLFQSMREVMRSDLLRTTLIQVLLLLFVLPFVFRTARGVLIPILCTLAALVSFLGICSATGRSISMLDVGIPGLILMIVVCDAIHLMRAFESAREHAATRAEAIRLALRKTGPACVLTSLTTAVGFGSLAASNHHAITDFGLTAAWGVGVGFAVVVTVVPLLLFIWPIRHSGHSPTPPPLLRASALQLGVLAVVLGAIILVGILKVNIQESLYADLPTNNQEVQNARWFEENFSGILRLEVTFHDNLFEPETFQAIEETAKRFADHPGVIKTEAYTDLARLVLPGDLPPDTDDLQLSALALSQFEPYPAHLLSRDQSRGKLLFHMGDVGTTAFETLSRDLEAHLAIHCPANSSFQVGGMGRKVRQTVGYVIETMLSSLGISLAVITLLLAIVFRSWRLALLSIPANAIPILIAVAATGWLDIPLRIGVVVVYCLGLGLAVDDSIHFLARFAQSQDEDGDQDMDTRLRDSLNTTGHALIQTSIILGLCALVNLTCHFQVLQDIGLLLFIIVVTALAADLFLLPVLLQWLSPKKSKRQ